MHVRISAVARCECSSGRRQRRLCLCRIRAVQRYLGGVQLAGNNDVQITGGCRRLCESKVGTNH